MKKSFHKSLKVLEKADLLTDHTREKAKIEKKS